ncbi:MAG: hypothetical protein HZA52_04005 [Planctomycetes bacterium]|nr:hypothetical protein [Planctomycetota bacterium]
MTLRRRARARAPGFVAPFVRSFPSVLAAALAAALGGGCNIPGARVYNLDELHDANGRHKYRAALVGDAEFLLREGFGGVLRGMGSSVQDKDPSKVEDPTEACVENLVGLLSADPHDPDIAAMQVELATRIVLTDVWRLSRERAAIGLGRAGERMGLASLPERVPGSTVANAEQLSDLLARFVKAVTPYVAGGDRDAARQELVALAAEARAFEYDAAGLPRALRGVRLLASRLGRDIGELRELSLDLQARAIRQGLEHALDDEDPFVAAAATWAGRRAFGDAWCTRVLARIRRGDAPPELLIAYADDLARRGAPADRAGGAADHAGGSAGDAPGEVSLRLLYELSGGHVDGRVRLAAMQALTAITGAARTSLREEDWQEWWFERQAASASAEPAPTKPAADGQP